MRPGIPGCTLDHDPKTTRYGTGGYALEYDQNNQVWYRRVPHGICPAKHAPFEGGGKRSVSPDPTLTDAELEGDLPRLESLAHVPVSLHDRGVRLPGAAAGGSLQSTLAHKRPRDGLRQAGGVGVRTEEVDGDRDEDKGTCVCMYTSVREHVLRCI